jgi:Erv1 / Alr family
MVDALLSSGLPPSSQTQPPSSTRLPKNNDKLAWGPQLWHTIHMVALNYPDRPSPSDKLNYKLFFESLKDVIPCLSCADNYAEHLQEKPIEKALDSAYNLFAWTIDLHNIANSFAGKPQWPLQDAIRFYSKYEPSFDCPTRCGGINGGGGTRGDMGLGFMGNPGSAAAVPLTSPWHQNLKAMFANLLLLLGCIIIIIIILYTLWRVYRLTVDYVHKVKASS